MSMIKKCRLRSLGKLTRSGLSRIVSSFERSIQYNHPGARKPNYQRSKTVIGTHTYQHARCTRDSNSKCKQRVDSPHRRVYCMNRAKSIVSL